VYKVDEIDFIFGTVPRLSKAGFNWTLNGDPGALYYIANELASGVVRSTFEYTPAPNDAGINTVKA
jgi:hypothetical protein